MGGADGRIVAAGRDATLIRAECAEHGLGFVSRTAAAMDAMPAYFYKHLNPC